MRARPLQVFYNEWNYRHPSLIATSSRMKQLTMRGKNLNITGGNKPWIQVDFKVFIGSRLAGIRPGLKVAYQRGSLPPVFADTKVFSYRLIFESSDAAN